MNPIDERIDALKAMIRQANFIADKSDTAARDEMRQLSKLINSRIEYLRGLMAIRMPPTSDLQAAACSVLKKA